MKDGYIPHNTHSFLTCSLSPDCVAHPLTPDQKMWLEGKMIICEYVTIVAGSAYFCMGRNELAFNYLYDIVI